MGEMNGDQPAQWRVCADGFALVLAWVFAAIVAHIVASHSDCVIAYRVICGWWAVLFVCSKLKPRPQCLLVALGLWILGSAFDLFGHGGWVYPKSVGFVSVEAARLIGLNAVFSLVVPFYLNRTVDFAIAVLRKTKRGQP